jgi:hypothetical protein
VSTVDPIADSALPLDVRQGTATDKANYKTALSFERELVQQLTQQLADTMQPVDTADSGDDDSGSSDAGAQQMQQMLPGVMADSIMSSGGLGLARQIAQNLKDTQS